MIISVNKKSARCMLTIVAFVFSVSTISATKKTMVIPGDQAGGNNLAIKLIKEIVQLDPQYSIDHPPADGTSSFSKVLADFEAGEIDVIWTLSSQDYEDKYMAVYYPLYKGMFGMRLPIVKKSESNQFAGVRTLDDMRAYKAGQGKEWADTPILKANGIPVVEVNKYFNHFPMLEGDRFDYFPRAIHEPWSEVKREAKYELTVGPNIMLRYRAPFYLFVTKDNKKLHQYLTEGMEKLVQSGKHDELFFAEESVQMALSNSNLKDRIVIDLINPSLSKKTPIDREELWFDPLSGGN